MKITRKNLDIREAVKNAGLFLWEVSDAYGISDNSLSRLLRKELDPETKAKIFTIIEELKAEAK